MPDDTREKLERLGYRPVERDGTLRIYINDLSRWYGLEYSLDQRTGAISRASRNGMPIGSVTARQEIDRLAHAQVWFDLADGEFRSKGLGKVQLREIIGSILDAR